MSNEGPPSKEGKLIGRVTHYFGKIGVAVIELSDNLKVGDTIKIMGGDTEFEQRVESMQTDHKEIEAAKSGDSIGLKIDQKAREGYKVYKL